MSKEPVIVDPSGNPIPSHRAVRQLENSNAHLRERVGLLSQLITARHGQLENSLQGLARSLAGVNGIGAGQDQVSSLGPLYRSNQYFPLSIDFTLLGFLYQTHGIIQTMVDEPVLDAFRADDGPGFTLNSREMGEGSVGKDGLGELEDFAEEIGAWEALKYMLTWGGLYGGSGLVINSGQDVEKPLDPNDIKRGNLEFYDADRWEFAGTYRSSEKFMFYGQNMDATRVITYGGKRAPRLIRTTLGGWGMSEIQRAVEDFNVWLRGRNALYATIDRANIDVYSIDGYSDTLLLPTGEQTIRARIQASNSMLNFAKALILDKNDQYQVVPRQFSGLAEVMKENRIGISCATRMPYVKLWGTAAGGSGFADGAEMENENYNALVMSRVRAPARPIIRKMLNLMMIAVFGKIYDISFEFKPLRVLSAEQEETIKTSKQNRYVQLYDKRVIDSQELGDLLHKEKLVPIETKAQKGLLPPNPEVPTAEQMFKEPEQGEEDGKRSGKEGSGAPRAGERSAEA